MASAGLATALALAACGSSSTTSTTTSGAVKSTTTPSSPAAALAALETPPTGSMTIQEDGSSLVGPLFAEWATGFKAQHSGITIDTGDAGSGTGIADAEAGTIDIGASDAYLPPATI